MSFLQFKKLAAEISDNLLRVAVLGGDARCTSVQLRFSPKTAAARDGSPKFL